jgi:hypothetical protein
MKNRKLMAATLAAVCMSAFVVPVAPAEQAESPQKGISIAINVKKPADPLDAVEQWARTLKFDAAYLFLPNDRQDGAGFAIESALATATFWDKFSLDLGPAYGLAITDKGSENLVGGIASLKFGQMAHVQAFLDSVPVVRAIPINVSEAGIGFFIGTPIDRASPALGITLGGLKWGY